MILILRRCLTVLFDQALTRAEDLDAEFAKSGETKGPLHGVPITFKDQCKFLCMRFMFGDIY